MRSGGEVFHSDGLWYLTSAEASKYAARHPELFSATISGSFVACPVQHIPASIDPPAHARYRRIIDPMFSPRVLNSVEGDLRKRVNLLIDKFIDSGRCEVIRDIAEIFPTEVFCLMFGLPLEDRDKLIEWVHATLAGTQDPVTAGPARAAGHELAAYLTDLIQYKRMSPGDNILGRIIAESDLTNDEIVGLSFNVAQGGLDTVTSAIGFMMNYVAADRDLRHTLLADPDQVGPFIEEVVRLESVAPWGPRITTQEVEIRGTTIPAQSVVMLGWAVANRDPKMFRTPNGIDLAQGHEPHLGFGSANHRCLGSHLARRELKVVFEEFHRRIPEYSLEPGAEPVQIWPSLLLRLDAVPLVFAQGGGA
jgi:cytochrome P450